MLKSFSNITLSEHDIGDFNLKSYRISKKVSILEVLRQSNLDPVDLLQHLLNVRGIKLNKGLLSAIAITVKYQGYIDKSQISYKRVHKNDNKKLDFNELLNSENISFECKQRIRKIQPVNLGQLTSIAGLRPSTIAVATHYAR
jgi:tRNA uridine 5-carboxymethylaminomethyl modification enzyme